MYLPANLTSWQRFLEWCFPWRRHAREKAMRENMRWVSEKITREERGGYR